MDKKIDFLVVGAQRSGTTSFYEIIRHHPEIFMPAVKEVVYFSHDYFYSQGEAGRLDGFFAEYAGQRLMGTCDANLLYFPVCAERIHAYNRSMKIIVLLRHPVERAYSAFWYARRNTVEPAADFGAALERERGNPEYDFAERAALEYLAHGRYAEQLERFISRFGRERVLIHLTADFERNPQQVLDRSCEFLGVAPIEWRVDLRQRANYAGKARFGLFQWLVWNEGWHKWLSRRLLPLKLRVFINRQILQPILRFNVKPVGYPPLDPGLRRELLDYYRPYNRDLARLTGLDLSGWEC